MRMVTTMHEKQSCWKGCVLLTVHVSNDKGKDVEDVEEVYGIATISGCVSKKYFRVTSSHGSGLFYYVGTMSSSRIKGILQDEHSRANGIEVAVEGNA